MKTSDIVLIILAVFTVIFTVIMLQIYWTHYAIPDTLVTCWFTAVTGECGALGWIKTTKVRHEDRRWMLEDYQRYKGEQNDANERH